MTTWLTKRRAGVAFLLPALVVVLLATRTWVTGHSSDPVLGGRLITATGNQAAPGLLALGLVALAAGVAVLTTSPRLRMVSSVILTLAGLSAVILTVTVIRDPSAALGVQPTGRLPRTGTTGSSPPGGTQAGLTIWPWPELVASIFLTLVGALSLPAGRRWQGLSSRFDRPDSPEVAERVARRSAWDDLSEGRDPTLETPSVADPDAGDAAGAPDAPDAPDAAVGATGGPAPGGSTGLSAPTAGRAPTRAVDHGGLADPGNPVDPTVRAADRAAAKRFDGTADTDFSVGLDELDDLRFDQDDDPDQPPADDDGADDPDGDRPGPAPV